MTLIVRIIDLKFLYTGHILILNQTFFTLKVNNIKSLRKLHLILLVLFSSREIHVKTTFILQPRETEKLKLWADFKGHGVCTGFHKHGLKICIRTFCN